MSPGPFYPASVLPSYPSHPSPPLPIPGCQHLLPAFPRPGFLTSCPTPLPFHHHPIFRDLLSHPGQGGLPVFSLPLCPGECPSFPSLSLASGLLGLE